MTPCIENSNNQELGDIDKLFNKFPYFVCMAARGAIGMKMKPLPTTLLAANSKNAEQALLFSKDSGSPTALS